MNRFSFVSTTNAKDVEMSLQNLLTKPTCQFFLIRETSVNLVKITIVDCSNDTPTILRIGVIKNRKSSLA